MINLTSVFGGTSVYWGILWCDVDSSSGCLSSGEKCVYYGFKASMSLKFIERSLSEEEMCTLVFLWKYAKGKQFFIFKKKFTLNTLCSVIVSDQNWRLRKEVLDEKPGGGSSECYKRNDGGEFSWGHPCRATFRTSPLRHLGVRPLLGPQVLLESFDKITNGSCVVFAMPMAHNGVASSSRINSDVGPY